MEWSTKLPVRYGWYWLKDGVEDVVPVRVVAPFMGDPWMVYPPHWTLGRPLAKWTGCLWFGPIVPPPLPEVAQ